MFPELGFELFGTAVSCSKPKHFWRETFQHKPVSKIGILRDDAKAVVAGILPHKIIRSTVEMNILHMDGSRK